MANDINNVLLTGRLTRDVEVKQVGENQVAKFGFASNYYQGKNKDEGTVFLDCQQWGPRAKILEQYCKKGSPITLVAELRMDNWDTDDGQKRSKIYLEVKDFKLAPKSSNDSLDNPQPSTKSQSDKKSQSKPKPEADVPF